MISQGRSSSKATCTLTRLEMPSGRGAAESLARRTTPPCREFKTVPETALGHPSLSRHADLAFLPARFSKSPRDIENLALWRPISRSADLAGSEGDRGCEAIQNCYPGATRPPAVRNAADLKGWYHAATDRGVACCGAAASAEGEGGGWRE